MLVEDHGSVLIKIHRLKEGTKEGKKEKIKKGRKEGRNEGSDDCKKSGK